MLYLGDNYMKGVFIMKALLVFSKKFKVLFCAILAVAIVLTSTNSVMAGPTNLRFNMSNGGTWTYDGRTDTDVTKYWSAADWMSAIVVQKVTFLSPTQVKDQLYQLTNEVGLDMSKEVMTFGVETAVSLGIDAAKKKLTERFGASLATKAIPILSLVSWTYTAIDIVSTMGIGQNLYLLNNAARNNQGLIYVEQRNMGDMSKWYTWDGSSHYGAYPAAILNPNNWQYGNIVIN